MNNSNNRCPRTTNTLKRRTLAFLMSVCMLLPLISPVWANEAGEITTAQSSEVQTDTVQNDRSVTVEEVLAAEDCNILQYVDAEAFDRADHLMRLPEMEDLNTYVFANRDGSRSVYFMDENVKFIDANGKITEKDISLVAKEGGYGVARNDVGLLLPTLPAGGIDVGYAGYSVKLIPQGGSDLRGQKIDNSIVYEGYYGTNTSLKYTPILSGVKEDIVLDAYTGNVSYTFLLETDGLTLYSDGAGYYLSETANADKIFRLGEVIVYDAMGKPSVGSMSVETVEAGKRYKLTIAADNAFLTDPSTVYPVTIDPTITVSDTESLTGQIEDAPIYEGYPDRCYGNYIYNRVGTASEAYARGRTVVRLTGLNESAIYRSISAGQIVSVTFNVVEASGGTTQTAYAYPLTNTAWTETTVTWNNAGSYSTAVKGEGTLTPRRASTIDITELVKSWKNGTHSAAAGFVVIGADETVNKSFFSSEYSVIESRPYVELTYTPIITLSHTELSMVVNQTQTLTATTIPSGLDVVWNTSDPNVATVSETGVVTIIGNGDAFITASVEGGEVATCVFTVRPPTVTLDHSEIELVLGESQALVATTFPPGLGVEWQSNSPSIATVDSNGLVTGYMTGTTKIVAMYMAPDRNMYIAECTVDVRLPDGSYFLENVQTGYYADIKGPTMADGTTIHQWSFHGGPSQKWYFTHLGDGYYSIHSKNADTPYYLGVKNDSSVVDTDVVLRTGTLTDGMKWKIEFTKNGAYKIIPKTGEAKDYVLATSTSSATNGAKLLQGDYADNTSYRDEWNIEFAGYTFVHYYDSTFLGNQQMIDYITQAQLFVEIVYLKEFGVEIRMKGVPIYYEGTYADQCTLDPNVPCTDAACGDVCTQHHKNIEKNWSQIYNDIRERNHIYVMWSGRSVGTFCWDDAEQGHITPNWSAAVYDFGSIIQVLALDNRVQVNEGVMPFLLAHEFAHTFGMPDVVHEEDVSCILNNWSGGYEMLYDGVMRSEGYDVEPFCASCKEAIYPYTIKRVHEGN